MESNKKDGDKSPLHIQYKIWLEKDGAIFGDGLYLLLTKVAAHGSISEAAREMGMSYRSAWGKIKVAEKHWKVPLVLTKVGGELGGGAQLTPVALDLLQRYLKLRQEANDFLNDKFKDIFRDWPGP